MESEGAKKWVAKGWIRTDEDPEWKQIHETLDEPVYRPNDMVEFGIDKDGKNYIRIIK